MKFKKGPDGNWYNVTSKYYLGTENDPEIGEIFWQHLYDSGHLSIEDIIDNVMRAVNDSIEAE